MVMLFRLQHICWFALFGAVISTTTSLIDMIQANPELSTLYGYVNASSKLTSLISSAGNFTLLAASNDAITTFTKANPNVLTGDLLLATIQYSFLQGIYPSLSFTKTSQFVASTLLNTSFTNVTAGQTVELTLSSGGSPQVLTGNKSTSTSTLADIVCSGGLIHIMDSVLEIPISAVDEISEIPLEYFVSMLNEGDYLISSDADYVQEILNVPDVTYFMPNSATALANFTSFAKTANASELQAFYEYHLVPGWVGYSSSLKNGTKLKTVQGSNITITVQDGEIFASAARVIATDYLVSNGVVHVLDNFLDRFDTAGPPTPTSSATSQAPTSTPTTVISSATASSTSTADSKSHTSSGTTIGIAVGVSIAAISLIAAAVWFFVARRKMQRESTAVWDQSIMSSSGKFYIQRGQVKRDEDVALGLQSPTLRNVVSRDGHKRNEASGDRILEAPCI